MIRWAGILTCCPMIRWAGKHMLSNDKVSEWGTGMLSNDKVSGWGILKLTCCPMKRWVGSEIGILSKDKSGW